MRSKANHRPDVWLDFTGEALDVYERSSGVGYNRTSMPFHVALKRTDLGSAEARSRTPRRVSTGRGREQTDFRHFHRFMGLLTGEEEVTGLLWHLFFRENHSVLPNMVYQRNIVLLLPTAWEPQISKALLCGFGDAFEGSIPNIYTEATVMLFSELWERRDEITRWPLGKTVNVQATRPAGLYDSDATVYDYALQRRESCIYTRLSGWRKGIGAVHLTNDEAEGTTRSEPEHTPAAKGFLCLLDYLDQKQLPRVDMDLEITIGILSRGGGFLPFLTPVDPTCHWFGHTLKVQDPSHVVDIPLFARLNRDENLFPLARLTIPRTTGDRPANGENISLWLRKVHHAKIETRIVMKQNGTEQSILGESLLPRLYH